MKRQTRSIWITTGVLILVPLLLFSIVHWYQGKFEKLPVLGGADVADKGISLQHTIAQFEFEDQDKKIFSSNAVKGKIIVANFFFTSCPGICPNMMKHVKLLQAHFPGDSNIIFISFTVDPERDSAARLKWYAEHYDINTANWSLLTGNKREIYKLARKSFLLTANEGDGGQNDFIHSEQLVLIDKNSHIRGYFDGTNDKTPDQLNLAIKKLEYE